MGIATLGSGEVEIKNPFGILRVNTLRECFCGLCLHRVRSWLLTCSDKPISQADHCFSPTPPPEQLAPLDLDTLEFRLKRVHRDAPTFLGRSRPAELAKSPALDLEVSHSFGRLTACGSAASAAERSESAA